MADIPFLAKVERRAEGRYPLRAHPISVGKRDHPAIDGAFHLPKTKVYTASRRTAEKSAYAERMLALIEEVDNSVGKQRQSIAHMPAEIVIPKPHNLAEVVAVGVGKQADVGIQSDPVDDMLIAGRAAFCLPTLPSAQAHDRQVVDHFGALCRYPTAHARAHGISTFVKLRWNRPAEVIDNKTLPFGLDRIVVQRIVQRQRIKILIGIGKGEFGLENHLVCYSVDVEHVALDRRID